MSGLKYTAYQIPTAEWIVHPDGKDFCDTFHAKNAKCLCEMNFPSMVVEMAFGYFICRIPDMVDTGFRIDYKGKTYEVFSVD